MKITWERVKELVSISACASVNGSYGRLVYQKSSESIVFIGGFEDIETLGDKDSEWEYEYSSLTSNEGKDNESNATLFVEMG